MTVTILKREGERLKQGKVRLVSLSAESSFLWPNNIDVVGYTHNNWVQSVGLGACRGCIPKPKILIKQIWSEAFN